MASERTAWTASLLLVLLVPMNTVRAEPQKIVLADFSEGDVGDFPPGWRWRGKDDNKPKRYVIEEENGRRYLNAKDSGHSVLIIKKVSWAVAQAQVATIVVSNEVGMGLVSSNPLARKFCDTLGFINQRLAKKADTVYFMHAGIPRRLK